MSAMSASSGLMPLSLISEHKAAQGGPPAVQPLQRTPEKHSLVQAPKPTPNGMEPSPPLIPLLPPSQPEPQPSLPCGGKSETVSEEDRSGGSVPEIQVPAAEPAPPSIGAVPEQPLAAEAAELPIAPELPITLNQAPSSPKPAPTPPARAPTPTMASNMSLQPQPAEAPAESEQESLPKPEAVPIPEPAQVPQPELDSKTTEESTKENSSPTAQEPSTSPAPALAASAAPVATQPPAPPSTRQPKRTKKEQNSNNTSNEKKVPSASEEEEASGDDKKPKRKRLPTQPYQSPIPELNLIAKISKIDKAPVSSEDKLVVFYKNEFLAVRNAEGGFYVCKVLQKVHKTSSRIKIRWLSQVANTDHYSPDFYDNIEFDCILTNLNLEKIDKNKYRLPDDESQRTQSILKRAIDAEKGIAPPEETSVTEEHPDGLDLSLYRNEDQLKKRKRSSKKKGAKKKEKAGSSDSNLRNKSAIKKVRSVEVDKKTSAVAAQSKRLGRPVKVEKPVVQRIVAAKKMGRRKAVGAASAAVKPVRNETKSPPAVKRKSESQPSPVPEKKLKTGASSKTRSGVAGGPSGPQQRVRRSATRTK